MVAGTTPDPEGSPAHDGHGRSFWVGLALGTPVGGYGIWWLLHNANLTMPRGWATTLGVSALLHDLVLVPVVLTVGWAVHRWIPQRAAGPTTVALMLSSVVALYAVPAVGRFGERPSNPTLLPRDTGAWLVAVLAVIWGVTLVVILIRWLRTDR